MNKDLGKSLDEIAKMVVELSLGELKNEEEACDNNHDLKENRPDYYREGRKYEPKDVIKDWDLNFNLGNVVKYVSRAGRKDYCGLDDLIKARTYLQFEIEDIYRSMEEDDGK